MLVHLLFSVQVAAACDHHRLCLAADVANQCCEAAAQSGKDGSHDNIAEGEASSEHSHGSLHHFIREDEADAQVLLLDKLLLSEVSSDETLKDYDGISEPTPPEADPVGEPATPEGLLHKASWTFISAFR